MTVQITAGEMVSTPRYTNMIRITANYMHGDANGYTSEVVMYPREELDEVRFDAEGLALLRSLSTGQYGITLEDARDRVIAFYAENGYFGKDEEIASDFAEQFVINDDHDDSYEYAATLQTVDFVLFDEKGDTYELNVLVNGEPLK